MRVKAIVGSFEPRRSQSSEERLKSTLVLAALQQARLRKATTSRRNSTSLQLAPSNDVDSTLGSRSILRAVAAALTLATS